MKILKRAEESLEKELPFVVYNKPNEKAVKGFFQKSEELFTVTSYTESGFIFAPFDNKETSILIPNNQSDFLKEDISFSVSQGKFEEVQLEEAVRLQHIDLVKKGIVEINTGSLKKVVLSRKENVFLKKDSVLDVFKRLVKNYPTAFVYLWFHPKVGMWIGATPETLLNTTENTFKTMSLAGTLTAKNEEDIVWGEKELEEQEMVTDYLIEKIGSITKDYKVSKQETYRIGDLFHLRTKVEGTYNESIESLINLLHPTPAVCGFPKEKAKQFILENEMYQRKFYTGYLGELNIGINSVNSSSLFVNLRCMEVNLDGEKGTIYVGGGITKDSEPQKEFQETIFKSYAIKNNLY